MSIDILQNKIKKCGSVLMVDLSITEGDIPPVILEAAGSYENACFQYAKQLLDALKGKVAAVKFRFLPFVLRGSEGLERLSKLLEQARSLGFYTLLELSGISTPEDSVLAASVIWGSDSVLPCDAIQISGFFGSDIIKPFLPGVDIDKKDLFVTARSSGKSSAEIQDLLTGSRTVHLAIADNVNRYSAASVGKNGFSRVGIAASAHSSGSIQMLRSKYPKLFMLLDGFELPGSNAKSCSFAFDNMGHGAVIVVSSAITQAWKDNADSQNDYASTAIAAAEKIQEKLDRYITIL